MSAFDPLRTLERRGRLGFMAMEESEQRRYWRLRWLSSLQAFADTETQRNRWLDAAERNPHFSFVECMCSYFDDTNLSVENGYANRLSRRYVSAEEVSAVTDFHSLADSYEHPLGDDWDNEAVLADPKWSTIVEAAKRAQSRLLGLLADDAEKLALTQPLHWTEQNGVFHSDWPHTGSAP